MGQHLKVPLSQRTSSRSGSGLLSMAIDLKGQLVAQYARTFVGAPYQWAGTTPNGFDCSGLVFYVYRHFGFGLRVQVTECTASDLLYGPTTWHRVTWCFSTRMGLGHHTSVFSWVEVNSSAPSGTRQYCVTV